MAKSKCVATGSGFWTTMIATKMAKNVAGSGMMLVFGHRPLLMCCRVVFDALLRGFFMYFFPRFIAHVFTVVGIRPL